MSVTRLVNAATPCKEYEVSSEENLMPLNKERFGFALAADETSATIFASGGQSWYKPILGRKYLVAVNEAFAFNTAKNEWSQL